jgi:hypothetical protein
MLLVVVAKGHLLNLNPHLPWVRLLAEARMVVMAEGPHPGQR